MPPNRNCTTPRTHHLIPPSLPHLTIRILLSKPDAQPTHAPQHRRQRVLIALPYRHDALVHVVASIRVGGDGGDEERPDGVDGCVEGAFDGEGEEEGGEGGGGGEDGGVEACCSVVVRV